MPRAILTSKKSQADEATRAGIRYLSRTDLYALMKVLINRGLPPERNMITDGFHKPLCEFMQTTPYLKNLYMLPRGHLKTSLITIGRNIQRILTNPQVRILIASNKSENAEAMLAELKGCLADDYLVWAFPEILYADPARDAEKWTNSQIIVKRGRRTKEATIETIGVSGELTSKHYDHGTFDDVVGKENSQTRDLLQDTITFIRVAESLFDPGSTQDVIGTPWHYADAYAWLLEQRDKHGMQLGVFIRTCWEPAADGVEVPGFGRVRPTLPEKFSIEELLRIRAMKGSAEFAAQYLINPVSADTAYFPRDAILPNIVPRADLPPLDELWTVMTVDPAISMKAWADYSAIAVTGFDAHGKMYVLDLRRGKWPESELVLQMYDAWNRTPGIRAVGFEAIGFAKIFRRLLTAEGERRGFYLPVVALERDTKTTKNVRFRALQPVWEAGELFLAADLMALEDFLDETSRFRPDRESAHDDLIDAVVDALQLRVRPAEKEPEYLIDDPEVIERIQFESAALSRHPDLDRASLRNAYSMAKRRERYEQERDMANTSEFWG